MRVVLGVGGGIAAYKVAALLRLLKESGHEVRVVPTAAAEEFVGRATWEALSGEPVSTSVFDDVPGVAHIAIGKSAELVIVAPATADLLARAASGLADDLLTTTLLVARCPVIMAPAMHTEMWQHPATQANVATLRARGVHVMEPASGRLTGADSGPGRMPEPAEIFEYAMTVVVPPVELGAVRSGKQSPDVETTEITNVSDSEAAIHHELAGHHVLITAGGTREPIDPVRWIGNRSSGIQGVALAVAAAERGARVTLIAANVGTAELAPFQAFLLDDDGLAVDGRNIDDDGATASSAINRIIQVETALEMLHAVRDNRNQADLVIMAAAVADYRPLIVSDSKVKKEPGIHHKSIELVLNPDILAETIAERYPGQVIVGFAAETNGPGGRFLELGRQKAIRKGADITAVNEVGANKGFGATSNHVWLLDATGELVAEAQGSKAAIANVILDTATQLLQ